MFHEQHSFMNIHKQHLVEKVFGYLKEELGNKLEWDPNNPLTLLNGSDAIFTLGEMRIYVDARNEVRPTQIEALKVLKNQWGVHKHDLPRKIR